jgi:hypothetical protein
VKARSWLISSSMRSSRTKGKTDPTVAGALSAGDSIFRHSTTSSITMTVRSSITCRGDGVPRRVGRALASVNPKEGDAAPRNEARRKRTRGLFL